MKTIEKPHVSVEKPHVSEHCRQSKFRKAIFRPRPKHNAFSFGKIRTLFSIFFLLEIGATNDLYIKNKLIG